MNMDEYREQWIRNYRAAHPFRSVWFIMFSGIAIGLVIVWLFGCASPTVNPSLTTEQRADDLRFPCDLCGQPAKMSETENWYRCEPCSRPKVRPRLRTKKPELQIVKGKVNP